MKWRSIVDEKTGNKEKEEREVVSEDSDRSIRYKRFKVLCILNLVNIVIAIAAAVMCFCGSKLETGCAWLVSALAWSNVYDARVFSYRLNDIADESRSIAGRCLDLVSRIFAGMAVAVVKSGEETEVNGGGDGTAGEH